MPHGRRLGFLREHAQAPLRELTARQLGESVGYEDYRGTNLQYGLLASRIGQELGVKGARLGLLVEFFPPEPGEEWRLKMRSEFAAALKQAGWV